MSDLMRLACKTHMPRTKKVRLRVMSFNVWGAGTNAGKSVRETAAVLRASGADIIGLQETRPETQLHLACARGTPSTAARLARALGFFWHDQTETCNGANWSSAILSRYPIVARTPHDLGVLIDVGGRVFAFNVQLPDCPSQSFQVRGLEYCGAPVLHTARQAVRAAQAARRPATATLLEDLSVARSADAVFVLGDLNEPSHRDWTARTAAVGRHAFAVPFPTARAIEALGFTDTYRAAFPDEVTHPGYTWESLRHRRQRASGPPDRIDYVFARGPRLGVERVEIVGESTRAADLVVTPWPSDHRAVMATVTL